MLTAGVLRAMICSTLLSSARSFSLDSMAVCSMGVKTSSIGRKPCIGRSIRQVKKILPFAWPACNVLETQHFWH